MNIKDFPSSTKTLAVLIIGLVLGIIISSSKTDSTNDLRTPADNAPRTEEDVATAKILGLASFTGAWVSISGGEIVNDVNSVAIDCWLDKLTCNVAQADVLSYGSSENVFSNDIAYYDIIGWTESGQIMATNSSWCKNQVLNADLKTRVVTLTASVKDDADEELCVKDSEPIILKLDSRGY